MKKKFIITLTLVSTFGLGYALRSILPNANRDDTSIRKVTGIGGIFFKCKDPQKMRDWYNRHLGLHTNQYGAVFEWRQGADTTKKGFTQWSPFKETTTYFQPSSKDF